MPKGFYIRTEEYKKILRERMLGNKFNLGEKHSEETKKKQGIITKEWWNNPNNKNKIIERNKKLSLSFKGNKNPRYGTTSPFLKEYNKSLKGKTYDERFGREKANEMKNNYSNFLKGNKYGLGGKGSLGKHWNLSKETKQKMRLVNIGKKLTEETKKKIKEARAKQVFPIKDTKIEIKIQNFLKELKIEFYAHQYIHIEHGYQCDIFIPSLKLVIECDGDYWHGNRQLFREEQLSERILNQRDLDNTRQRELEEKGFKVLRLWESEIKVMQLNDFENIILT